MNSNPVILACDVGGTRMKLALVQSGKLLARDELPAHAGQGLALALARIAKPTGRLCRHAEVPQRELRGLGLAFPGIIEPRGGRILSTPAGKFDDSCMLDVPALVKRRLNLPVKICNDANAALFGEWRFGAARGCSSAVMMTLGTGIGTSAIVDGVPLRGPHGQAGCLGGHFTMNLAGNVCLCGNLGCAEAEASTWALLGQARAHPGFAASRLARERCLDFAAVFKHAARRDPLAVELRDRAIQVWSATLVSLVHAYDPELAVVGGGIMRSATTILPRIRQHVARHAWTPWGRVRIKAAALGNDAGLIGAASLFDE